MLQPKKQKYRKKFRGKMRGKAMVGSSLEFGEYGLKALGCAWLTSQQIEAGRKAIAHHTKRAGKIWICVFPDKSYTKKASGARMGGGKGDIEGYVAVIKPGRIIFEIAGVAEDVGKEALRLAGAKMPFKTRVIAKQ